MPKEAWAVLATIVGSALTIVGGLIASWRTISRERKATVREKLEQAALLAEEALRWSEENFRDASSFALGIAQHLEIKRHGPSPCGELIRLVRLYHTPLLAEATEYSRLVAQFHKSCSEYIIRFAPGETTPKKEEFNDLVSVPYDRLRPACNAFLDAIGGQMKLYL